MPIGTSSLCLHTTQFETPILLLLFNRPGLTARVFESVRELRPSKLYVAADGPRPEKRGEWQLCAETRKVLERVDWHCEVKTLLRDDNLGCGRAVSEGIDWFFGQEEEGIILEDDCLPDPSFFPFCAEMLARFRDNPQVGSVSGDNFFPPALHSSRPYLFSKYVQIWGWASWRRFWKLYDFHLEGPLSEWEDIIRRVNPIENHAKYWIQVFKALRAGLIDTWDYQVMFSAWRAGVVHIYPGKNLIVNLGYGADATHTNFESPLIKQESAQITDFEITLPVTVDSALDDATFYFRFLESLTNVWWLHQSLDLTEKLGWARWQNNQAIGEIARLTVATEKQAEQTTRILESRSKALYKTRLILLVAHLVFTLREAFTLARTRLAQILFRPRSVREQKQPKLSMAGSVSNRTSVHPDLEKDPSEVEPQPEAGAETEPKYRNQLAQAESRATETRATETSGRK
jgi:hypothetical protein